MPKKVVEKELKQPDKLQIAFISFIQMLSRNKQKVYLISIGVCVFIFLGGGYYLYHMDYEKKATLMYDKVFNSQLQGDQAKKDDVVPLDVFKDVISKYPNSQASRFAQYRMGSIHFDKGDFDASIKAYEAFLSRSSRENEIKTLAYIGLGYSYEEKKDYQNALTSFEKAVKTKDGKNFFGMTNRNIARIYEKMNEPVKAIEYYKKALNHTTDPSMQLLLKRKIATLS